MMAKCSVILLGISLLVGTIIDAYPMYQNNIPNGERVPNPCLAGTTWPGVGHLSPGGGGARNPFGLAFDANMHNWTAVCPLDSDGDGLTNGQELGDPGCRWVQGNPSPTTTNLTHPGICEPLSAAKCVGTNSWLTCPSMFDCPAINDPAVVRMPLRLPPTRIPTKETTYTCRAFALPNDTNYHVIATTPIINTSAVVHHMIVYMCERWTGNDTVFTQSVECFMGYSSCVSIVGLWGVGMTGQCLLNELGFRIGKNGFKYALLQSHFMTTSLRTQLVERQTICYRLIGKWQIVVAAVSLAERICRSRMTEHFRFLEVHWNNIQGSDSFIDSSGMTLYYTPKLRNNDALVLMSGQTSLEIPPRQSSVTYNTKCSEYCTSKLARSVNISWVTLHMHGLGKSGHVSLYRKGTLRAVLLNTTKYDYNDPPLADFRVPYEFLPGDEIHATCVFDSTNRNTTTRYGSATMDEMCFAFLTYYPGDPHFIICNQYRTADQCSNVGPNCDTNTFSTLSNTVQSVCTTFPNCSHTCQVVMQGIQDTGCLDGDIGLYFQDFYPGVSELRLIASKCGLSQNTYNTTAATPTATATTTT